MTTQLIYLISGTLYVFGCLFLYAIIRWGGEKIRNTKDFLVLLVMFGLYFASLCLTFFVPNVAAVIAVITGLVVSFAGMTDEHDYNSDMRWWNWLFVLVAFTVLAPFVIPLMIATSHFDLDKRRSKP